MRFAGIAPLGGGYRGTVRFCFLGSDHPILTRNQVDFELEPMGRL